jgi:asparagine synthetase A
LKELWEVVQRMARLVLILSVQSETANENGLVNGSSAVRPDNSMCVVAGRSVKVNMWTW